EPGHLPRRGQRRSSAGTPGGPPGGRARTLPRWQHPAWNVCSPYRDLVAEIGRSATGLARSDLWRLPVGDARLRFLRLEPFVVRPRGRHRSRLVDHQRASFFPILLIGGPHLRGDLGVLSQDVGLLTWIGLHVVERRAFL